MKKLSRRDALKMGALGLLGGLVGLSPIAQTSKSLLSVAPTPKNKKKKKRRKMLGFVSSATSGYMTTASYNFEIAYSPYVKFPGLIVGVAIFESGSVASIRTDATGPTETKNLTFIRTDANGIYQSELWYLPNAYPNRDENNLVVTVTVTLSAALASIAGAALYSHFGGIGIHNASASPSDPAINELTPTAEDSYMFSNLCVQSTSGVTDEATQTNRYADQGALGSLRGSDKGLYNPAEGPINMQFNFGVNDDWVMNSVELLNYIPNPPAIMGL